MEGSKMIRSVDFARGLAMLAIFAPLAFAYASPTITGEVRALQSQPIYTPPTQGPAILRYFVPDGTEVSPGETLLRIDPGQSASRLRALKAEIAKAEAVAQKEIAELDVKAIDAELALVEAQANAEKGRIDAALPRELVSALDFDRYKGEFERAERELVLKRRELDDARAATSRRSRDSQLELRRMRLEQKFHQVQLDLAEVRAERAGIVLHALDPRTGLRFEEGSTSFAGLLVGEVVSFGNMAVRAYALETERQHFAQGSPVAIKFDALPGATLIGKIESISGAPEPRAVWGDGRYFTIDILLNEDARKWPLLPGMSTRVRAVAEHEAVAESAR
jgi:HlyD family secretion protein